MIVLRRNLAQAIPRQISLREHWTGTFYDSVHPILPASWNNGQLLPGPFLSLPTTLCYPEWFT
jgi:hypothetical protein